MKEQGFFFLVYDAIGSRLLTSREQAAYQEQRDQAGRLLRRQHKSFIVEQRCGEHLFKTLSCIKGDSGGIFLNSSEAIKIVLEITEKIVVSCKLRWLVVKDDCDKELKGFV